MNPDFFVRSVVVSGLLLTLLSGCSEKKSGPPPGAGAPPPPPEVSVTIIKPADVSMINELPGRVEASRIAEVRARVAGIVQKRVFTEGSEVQAGDVLYQIDPAPFRAAANSAEAALARAEANLNLTNTKLNRYRGLVESNAISKQEFDDQSNAQKLAAADVITARSALETARLNLSYATVTAPIAGRIGRAQVTEGALVGQGEATILATVQQLNPVYVTMVQSSVEMRRLQKMMSSGDGKKNKARLTLVLEDGTVYDQPGQLLFSDVTVDPTSGSLSLRALFPNPKRVLLPGMYVRARVEQGTRPETILVPQQSVLRTAGGASVLVVSPEGKVTPRPVKTGGTNGTNWIITEGLKEGDQVIVEGLQKAKPGATVKPMPWQPAGPAGTPATGAPAAAPAATPPAGVPAAAAPAPQPKN